MYKLIIDLTDSIVLQEISAYREINNLYIFTEDTLDDSQIVETVLVKQLEHEQSNLDNSDKKPLKISAYKGLNELKTFILFAKQIDNNFFFNNNNLAVFQNYIPLIKQKITEFIKQKSITDFFKINEYSLNKKDFSCNNSFFNNDYNFSDNNNFLDNNFFDDNFSNNNFFDNDFLNNNFSDNDFFENKFSDNNFSNYSSFSNNYSRFSNNYEN
ncbi:2078_t:CDS:1 [Cetraspora pellucida]|uniref:2078_t:CDS:1 n=1 Tax=Cetraspora pellucida TaxID=1433469 RepID=A0A9N9F238_9GLOM|nr:2078_t:CDS:1 [Cetraspora pellucida]